MNDKIDRSKPWVIRERSYRYALDAIHFYRSLKSIRDEAIWIIGKQYLPSATSIGANVEEAQSGESRGDFLHKMSVAQKEARERLYWLRLMMESGGVPENQILPLLQETEELTAILTSIIVKTKAKSHS
ncbi:MAG: four helix bundle protein [Armatimonadetes bacterium]|nr:four helix bundle protein [Armatimonadota bacterium]